MGGEQCRIEYCVLNAMAKERLPALYVVVLAKNRSWVTQSLNARNAAVLGSAVATCAVVLAKSSQLIQISESQSTTQPLMPTPKRGRFPPPG